MAVKIWKWALLGSGITRELRFAFVWVFDVQDGVVPWWHRKNLGSGRGEESGRGKKCTVFWNLGLNCWRSWRLGRRYSG
jgi:hypothetical protein